MAHLQFEGFPAFDVPDGTTLLVAAELGRVPMTSACGGFAACNSCRVEVLAGGEGLTAQVPEEDAFLDGPRQRLGCQAAVRAGADVALRLCPG